MAKHPQKKAKKHVEPTPAGKNAHLTPEPEQVQENYTKIAVVLAMVLAVVVTITLLAITRAGGDLARRAAFAYEYKAKPGGSALHELLKKGYITQEFYEQETQTYESIMFCGEYDSYANFSYGDKAGTPDKPTLAVTITAGDGSKRVATTHWAKVGSDWAIEYVTCVGKKASHH